jgi:hypothetical protein
MWRYSLVASSLGRHTNNVHISIDGLLGKLLGRLEERANVHIESTVRKSSCNHLVSIRLCCMWVTGRKTARRTRNQFTFDPTCAMLKLWWSSVTRHIPWHRDHVRPVPSCQPTDEADVRFGSRMSQFAFGCAPVPISFPGTISNKRQSFSFGLYFGIWIKFTSPLTFSSSLVASELYAPAETDDVAMCRPQTFSNELEISPTVQLCMKPTNTVEKNQNGKY